MNIWWRKKSTKQSNLKEAEELISRTKSTVKVEKENYVFDDVWLFELDIQMNRIDHIYVWQNWDRSKAKEQWNQRRQCFEETML